MDCWKLKNLSSPEEWGYFAEGHQLWMSAAVYHYYNYDCSIAAVVDIFQSDSAWAQLWQDSRKDLMQNANRYKKFVAPSVVQSMFADGRRLVIGKLLHATFAQADITRGDIDGLIANLQGFDVWGSYRAMGHDGYGRYGASHVVRTALLCLRRRMPGSGFFEMGTGADSGTYKRLKDMRLWNTDDVNRCIAAAWPADSGPAPALDAMELAYYLCDGGLP